MSESLSVNFGTPKTYTVTSGYDNVGLRNLITYPDNTYVTRSYNNVDQLSQIKYVSVPRTPFREGIRGSIGR